MVTSRRMALLTGVLVGVGLLHGVAGIQPAAVSAEAAVAQAADAPPLWGTVRTASGEPMEGVDRAVREGHLGAFAITAPRARAK